MLLRRTILSGCLCWSVMFGTVGIARAAVPASETVLPPTTCGLLSVPNMPHMEEQWHKTQLSQLFNDPVMKAFRKDFRRQLNERFAGLRQRLGLSLDDLDGVTSGELAIAVVRPAAGQACRALLMDTTGRKEKANAMLAKANADLTKRGARVTQPAHPSAKIWVYDLPPQPDQKTPQQTIYFVIGSLIGVTDHMPTAELMVARATGQKGPCLADHRPFQLAIARCQKDLGKAAPQVRWYLQPVNYAEAAWVLTPEEDRRKGKTIHQVLRNQGFEGMQAVAGFVDFHVEKYEILHRTAAYAPPPYQLAMRMLKFPNSQPFTPQRWVPREIATYTTFYADLLNAFDNFGSLFDELVGDGEKGVWADTLMGYKKDPNGPKIDLRQELISHLRNRVTLLTDYKLPITPRSERTIYAIEVDDEQAVLAAIGKWMRADPSAKRQEWKGHIIWEIVEEESRPVPRVTVEAVPSVVPNEPPRRFRPRGKDEDDERERLLPHAAVSVAHGQLFVASHLDFLQKVLPLAAERETLARDLDFQIVTKTLDQLKLPANCARFFSRTDEEYRATYELIRQGRMPEAETFLARLLNGLFNQGKKGLRKQRIEGENLPDYQMVRRYLGAGGTAAMSEPEGWFVKGFTLPKQSQ